MDLSLDEIIKKNSGKRGSSNPRGRLRNRGGNKRDSIPNRATKPAKSTNGRVNKPSRGREPARSRGIADARLKIIQKTRQRLMKGDARDKLSQIAKVTDARSKIRGKNSRGASQVDGRRNSLRDRSNNTFRNAPVLLQRSIKNSPANMRNVDSLIRCTINRPEDPYQSLRPLPVYDDVDMSVDDYRSPMDISKIKVVAQNNYMPYRQDYSEESRMPEPMYIHKYEPQPYRREPLRMGQLSGGRMSQEMRARLDSPAKPPPYYSPTPHNPPPPPQHEGHRIVVSNLHSSVTHEDIKELFEDIGPLITSRLVRAGTAEVIYKFHKDAKQAVEAYHNRQLDGQPMKCLLVHPQGSRGSASSGVLRSSNVQSLPKFPTSGKSMVVPDLSAIHRALFTNK